MVSGEKVCSRHSPLLTHPYLRAMQLNLSADPSVWDNVESVTFQSTRKGNRTTTLNGVQRTTLSKKELAASGGVYSALDLVFLIPAVGLPAGWLPKPADVITDSLNTAFTVLEADGQVRDGTAFQTWKLICRDPIIAYDLQDLINIERAALSADDTGAVVKTFPPAGGQTLYQNLACRVQVVNESVRDQRLIHAVEGSYAVHVAKQLSVNVAEDRIRWAPQGGPVTYYLDLIAYHDAQMIDQLPILEARLRP